MQLLTFHHDSDSFKKKKNNYYDEVIYSKQLPTYNYTSYTTAICTGVVLGQKES